MATQVIDGKEYEKKDHAQMFIVTSGDPVFEVDYKDGNGYVTVDLTVSPSYPSAIVELPTCNYKFTGGSASVASVG